MPRYPIYIVSKGRFDDCYLGDRGPRTAWALHRLGVPHFVVVEEQEADLYRAVVPATSTILVLDPAYQRGYETCDDLGDTKGKGPGPARNFAWDHSLPAERHWVVDDNITGFWRLTRNRKIPASSGRIFDAMEDFVDRYTNVAMAGPNYYMFADRKRIAPPFIPNTRIYSCNLILNSAPYRWRGRYNEDTDLSLRMLKDGWCTIEFQTFLQWKMTTQTTKGGNTAEFYAKEGTVPKSQMLAKLHPNVTRLVWRFHRAHHMVDYRPFANNRLRLRPGVVIPDEPNEYGMVYRERRGDQWVTVDA